MFSQYARKPPYQQPFRHTPHSFTDGTGIFAPAAIDQPLLHVMVLHVLQQVALMLAHVSSPMISGTMQVADWPIDLTGNLCLRNSVNS